MDNSSNGHTCDTCGEPATHCWRSGRGTGHSEHECACAEHTETPELEGFYNPGNFLAHMHRENG